MSEGTSTPKLDTSLMPLFQEFKKDNESSMPGFGVWDYLNLRADSDLAAAFSKLFWPDFIEVDGFVFLAERYSSDIFDEWRGKLDGNRQAVESMINHVHIWDLFLNEPDTLSSQTRLHEYLAQVLLVCWKHALQEAFHDKHFQFSYLTTEEGYGPQISFYQAE